MSETFSADISSQNDHFNTSIQNFNSYLHISDPPKVFVRRDSFNREKPRFRNVNKVRESVKDYKKLFRAKKSKVSKSELCGTHQCIKDIVRVVSLAENRCDSSDDESIKNSNEEKVAFDYNNPQMLDIQGIDQLTTYRKDEQDIQIKREYEIMKRELDNRRLCITEAKAYEQHVRNEKFKLPDLFNIDIDPIYGENNEGSSNNINTNTDEQEEELESVNSADHREVALIRTKDKPKNQAIIEAEAERRVAALRDRLTKTWEKEKREEQERLEIEKKIIEELPFTLAQRDFEKLYEERKPEELFVRPPDPPPPIQYPNTFKELRAFRRKLNHERRELRDKCVVKEKVFEELGKPKMCKEKFLEADNKSDDVDFMSAQSSDGEDGLEMGYKNSGEFLVRGIHDKFSNEPRGKFLNCGNERPVKTCITHEEWIASALTECTTKKKRSNFFNTNDITNDSYNIFHRPWKYEKPKNVKSPVKEYIEKGNKKVFEYKPKPPNVKPPNYVKVKSFNLTDYLYGSTKVNEEHTKLHQEQDESDSDRNNLMEKIKQLEEEENERLKSIQRQRMAYLGFSCRNKTKLQKRESIVDHKSDHNWLPDQEILDTNEDLSIQLKTENIPLKISNMRAPEFREPTLRRHPRRLRQKSLETIPENDSRAPLNVPRLQKMDYDVIRESNMNEEKKELNNYFKYRHHHDHLDYTQQKLVRVKYIPKIQKFEETLNTKTASNSIKKLENTNNLVEFPIKSPCYDRDWSRYCSEEVDVIKNINDDSQLSQDYAVDERITKDTKLNKPGSVEKSRFNKFIFSTYMEKLPGATGTAVESPYEYPDAQKYREHLLEEQKSAASCISSASSSLCTNFTDDSGSFFRIMDKKVPLDFLTKHQVPFKPVTENHREANLIDKTDEYNGPYWRGVNAGQLIEMREICVPKYKFLIPGTKIRDLREHVKLEDQLIGYGDEKFKARFG